MDLVTTVDTVHWVFAFLVLLCAVTMGWMQLGQRVMVAVIGIQVLIGIVLAVVLGAGIGGLGARVAEHIVGALLAMGAYIAARRAAQSGVSRPLQLTIAAVGLLLLIGTAYLGLKMHGRIA
ncbi:MAG: hypothetical protein M3R30_02215 [Candidatus Eremiobacteraeota bacterium]|nr:hypothetical protein [Candidatus Eremiobacteraeota bacterium]